MDHQKFSNILGGIQSLVLSCAILVGGIWTLFTFDALKQAEIAEADARTKEAELLQKLKALEERRVLVVALEPEQIAIPGDPARYVVARVRFENVGNHTEQIFWSEDSLTVSRVSIDGSGPAQPARLRGLRLEAYPGEEAGLRLMPGVVVNRLFLARVPEPGLYYLEFNVQASLAEQALAAREGLFGSVSWREVGRIVVE